MEILTRPERTQALLQAALKVFGEKGYLSTQISDIIEEAGVARGTFYLYFESKKEIFSTLLDTIFSEVNSMVESLPRNAVMEIPSKIKGNLQRITHLLTTKPEIARVLLCESVSLNPESDEKLAHFYGQLLGLIERAIKQGQEMGFVRKGKSIAISVFLLGMIKELFYQNILKTISPPKKMVDELYNMIVASVARPEILAELQKNEG